ncbi:MFS transporter [Sporomusa sp.]|uniref:MFS transporter n=1 Tax=Sporomusa sp. TaxID=2078658 RepID=UPI002CB8CFEA|nr:MFS transporter [Sporomusa sp.]HWR41974.1 MFS transporter [Sporomusa sp.]
MRNFRWWLAVLMFLVSFISYMDRVNLSVATPDIMKEFGFNKMDMGFLQTMFFLGYALMQIPGGIMSEYFGHRRVVTIAVTWWSAFTALTATSSSFTTFAIVRGLFGLGEGPVFPAFNNFVYRWFNKNEKATAASFMLGGAFVGPVFGPGITVALMLAFGWRSVFIIFGVAGLALATLWYFFAAESPRNSKFVTASELDHIESGRCESEEKREIAPWRDFMSSPQFWAIGIQYFITDYIMYVFLAWLPLYLMEAQKFSLAKMGIAAAFPWALLCILTFTAGFVSDKMIAAGVSKHNARTWFGSIGLVVCCVTLYFGAVAKDPWMNVMWLTLSLGSLGFTFSASWAACIDIGGKFAGSVSGWMNFWGNIGGVLAPICTAWIATNYGWQAAIVTTAVSAVIGVIAWFMVKPDVPIERRQSGTTPSVPVVK